MRTSEPRLTKLVALAVMLILAGGAVMAQGRKVTPVENEDNKPPKPQLHYYDEHGNPLDEPVLVWVKEDTVRVSRAPKAPLYNGVSVGVNFFDAIMRLAGQTYSDYDVWASVSLHNWFFPTLELGFGSADSTPKDKNFTYKCSGAFYARVGLDYNFLYNSNPDYNVFVGIRAGFSSFKYDIDNIIIGSDYWEQTGKLSLRDQKSTALWGEAVAGLKVKIYKHFSMGWTLRYKFRFHVSDGENSTPWFIPGYGGRNAPFSATLSAIYTF